MLLKSRHALVTGSGKRLGRAIAEALLKTGMNLSAHYYQSHKEVMDLVYWAKTNNLGQVTPIKADLRNASEIERLSEISLRELGEVALLVNSASDFYPTPLGTTSDAQWESLFNLNLKAPYFLTQQITPRMPKDGHVVFIADVHGSRPIKNYGPYCATKAGVISMTRTLAKELAPNIRVNCISPGTVLPAGNATSEEIKKAELRSLFGRTGNPNDIVEGLLFLCRNDYITGNDLIIDGGRSLL